jgi:hypothetical protein
MRNDTIADRRAHARENLLAFGDLRIWGVVIDAVAALPEDAFRFAVTHCVFVLVGAEADGWTSSSQLVDRDGKSRQRLIVLGPNTTAALVRHELAHAMHADLASGAAISCVGELGLREHFEAIGLGSWAENAIAAEEDRANDAAAQMAVAALPSSSAI